VCIRYDRARSSLGCTWAWTWTCVCPRVCTVCRSQIPKWRHIRPPARAFTSDGISNVGHIHRTEKSSRNEPETLHSKPNEGLSVENEKDGAKERERERERGGIKGRFKIEIATSSDISSPFLARATSREQTCRAPDFLFFSLFFHPPTLFHYPRSFGTTSCHLRAGHIFSAGWDRTSFPINFYIRRLHLQRTTRDHLIMRPFGDTEFPPYLDSPSSMISGIGSPRSLRCRL